MTDTNRERRHGDLLLDRYFKDADEETRERARERLRSLRAYLRCWGRRNGSGRKASPTHLLCLLHGLSRRQRRYHYSDQIGHSSKLRWRPAPPRASL